MQPIPSKEGRTGANHPPSDVSFQHGQIRSALCEPAAMQTSPGNKTMFQKIAPGSACNESVCTPGMAMEHVNADPLILELLEETKDLWAPEIEADDCAYGCSCEIAGHYHRKKGKPDTGGARGFAEREKRRNGAPKRKPRAKLCTALQAVWCSERTHQHNTLQSLNSHLTLSVMESVDKLKSFNDAPLAPSTPLAGDKDTYDFSKDMDAYTDSSPANSTPLREIPKPKLSRTPIRQNQTEKALIACVNDVIQKQKRQSSSQVAPRVSGLLGLEGVAKQPGEMVGIPTPTLSVPTHAPLEDEEKAPVTIVPLAPKLHPSPPAVAVKASASPSSAGVHVPGVATPTALDAAANLPLAAARPAPNGPGVANNGLVVPLNQGLTGPPQGLAPVVKNTAHLVEEELLLYYYGTRSNSWTVKWVLAYLIPFTTVREHMNSNPGGSEILHFRNAAEKARFVWWSAASATPFMKQETFTRCELLKDTYNLCAPGKIYQALFREVKSHKEVFGRKVITSDGEILESILYKVSQIVRRSANFEDYLDHNPVTLNNTITFCVNQIIADQLLSRMSLGKPGPNRPLFRKEAPSLVPWR